MIQSMRGIALVALLALASSLCACGDEEGITFEGTVGERVEMTLRAWVPTIDTTVDEGGGSGGPMLVDTGAPLTLLAKQAHPALGYSYSDVTLRAFKLIFPAYPVAVTDLFETGVSTCQDDRFDGLIGGDLLRHFRLGLDYKGERAMLFHGDGPDAAVASGTDAAQRIAVEVAGGGAAILPKINQPISVGATRLLVTEAWVEGSRELAMVDTGASLSVISKELLTALGDGTARPQLCCESVGTLQGTKQATLTRLASLRLGNVTVKNLPVMVLDDSTIFSGLSAELGRPVRMLIGGSFLRLFAVRVDYEAQALELSRYSKPDHVSPDEYVLPGFSFCKARNQAEGMVVLDVYKGSDAEKQGVTRGNLLLAVDGTSTADLSVDQVRALLNKKPVGSKVKLTFRGTPANLERELLVQRLLPDYP